jgi:hypothetical protein
MRHANEWRCPFNSGKGETYVTPCLVFGAKFSDTNGTPLNPIRLAYRRGIVVTPIKNYNFIVDLAGGDLEMSHRDYNFS